MVDEIFGSVLKKGSGASVGLPSIANLFAPPGLFAPSGGAAESAAGSAGGAEEESGLVGPRGIRFPGVGAAGQVALNLVLAGLLLLGLFLFGLSALPTRLVGRTPIAAERFREARLYLAAAATSILLSLSLLYGLGKTVF